MKKNYQTFLSPSERDNSLIFGKYRNGWAFLGIMLLMGILSVKVAFGQTIPVAQSLPYSQNFASFTGSTTTYPAGWQGWTVAGSLSTAFPATAPSANQALAGGTNATTTAGVYDMNGKIGIVSTGSNMRSVVLTINTTGATNIVAEWVAATQYDNNGRTNAIGLQYRVGGTVGTFTDIPFTSYQNIPSLQNTGTAPKNPTTVATYLPAACENQAIVQLRWIIRDISGSGNRPSFSVDNVVITPNVPPININLNAITPSAQPEGTGVFNIQATAVSAVTSNVTINVAISGNETITASDYTLSSATLTISTGNTNSNVVTLSVNNDDFCEGNETVTVTLTTSTPGYAIVTATQSLTLTDDLADLFYPLATLGVAAPTVTFDNLAVSGLSPNVPVGHYFAESGTNANLTYGAGDGTSSTGNTFSFGVGVATERAFGTLCTGSMGNSTGGVTDPPVVHGLRLRNTTGGNINTINVKYIAELWRRGDAADEEIRFQYSLNATSITSGTWTTVNALTFTPSADIAGYGSLTLNTGLNGNLPANRVTKESAITLPSLVPNNGYIWIRFFDYNSVNADDAVGIDDIEVTPLLIFPTTYYPKAVGELTSTSTWGTNLDGTGASPANFTAPSQIFDFRNRASYTPLVNWTISGAGSKLVVHTGSNLIIPAGVVINGEIDIRNGGQVTINNPSATPNFGVIASNSTIQYSATSAQNIPAITYGNLTVSGPGTKTFAGATINILGNLTLSNVTTDYGTGGFLVNGNVTYTGTVIYVDATLRSNTFTFTGGNAQVVNTNGNTLHCFNFIIDKTGGSVTLAANTPVESRNTIRCSVFGSAKFVDGGNNMTATNNLEFDGSSSSNYVLTGTTTLNFTQTSGSGNVRNNATQNRAAVAHFQNLIILNNGTGTATDILIRGQNSFGTVVKNNFSIGGSSTLGGIDLVNNSALYIGGAFINTRNEATLQSDFQGRVIFNGSGAVSITTQTTGGNKIQRFDTLRIQRFNAAINVDGGLEFDGGLEGSSTHTINMASPSLVRFFGSSSGNSFAGNFTIPRVLIGNTSPAGVVLSPGSKLNIGEEISFAANGRINTTAGELRLKSTPSLTARFGTVGAGAVITGNVTSERYIPTSGWHFTGSVFAGNTVADWNDDFTTQGPMPGVNIYNPGSNTSNIFEFDQAYGVNDGLGEANGWKVPTSSNIGQYQGYRLFVPAGRVLDYAGAYTFEPAPIAVSNSGAETYRGWNLLVNPHLSAINVAGITFGSGVQNSIVVWNPVAGQYQYTGSPVVGATLNAGITPIASGQGFFVYTASNSTVTIPQTAKSAANGTFFRTASAQTGVEITLKSASGKQDAALFQFVAGTSSAWEPAWDAMKVMNPDVNLFTIGGLQEKLAINALPFEGSQTILPLGFKVAEAGEYSISFIGSELAASYGDIYLKDNELGIIKPISDALEYTFATEAGLHNDRLEIIVVNEVTKVEPTLSTINLQVFPNPSSNGSFSLRAGQDLAQVALNVLDAQGKVVYTSASSTLPVGQAMRVATSLPAGAYVVKVQHANGLIVKSLIVK